MNAPVFAGVSITMSSVRFRLCRGVLALVAACSPAAPDEAHPSVPAARAGELPVASPPLEYRAPAPVRTRSEGACRTSASTELRRARGEGIERAVGGRSVSVAVGVGGRLVYGHRVGRPRVPASNQKLLLAMAVLDELGPSHRIRTSAAAPRVRGGAVDGDLWIIGRGDPTVATSPDYWGGVGATSLADLAARIVSAGVHRVRGRIMGAHGYFATDHRATGWQPYVPGRFVQLPSALVVDGNNSGDPEPERAAAAVLTEELRRLGVAVAGRPGSGRLPRRVTQLAEVRSRPLEEIVAHMSRTSNNFFAEMLGKVLGAAVFGRPGTIAKGARATARWARSRGVEVESHDGSGLSYANRISARGLLRLLGAARREPWGHTLRRGLPGAGDGTLSSRLDGLDVRAKTGTLFNGASALSGWVRSERDGRWIAFSILGMGTPKAVEDAIVRAIARARLPSRRRC